MAEGERPPLEGHTGGVLAATFNPDGSRVATAGVDGTVRVYDAATSRTLLTFTGHNPAGPASSRNWPVTCVAFSPDGKRVASGSGIPDPANPRESVGTVYVWDADTGKITASFQGHTGLVRCLAFTPDGAHVVSAAANKDNSVVVWDARTGQVVRNVTGHDGTINAIRFSPDGKVIATGDANGVVRLWDGKSFDPIRVINNANGLRSVGVRCVAFSPTGAYLVTASDPLVHVWDVATGAAAGVSMNAVPGARSISVSPDGKRIAVGGDAGTVQLIYMEPARRSSEWEMPTTEQKQEVLTSWGGYRSTVITGRPEFGLRGHKDIVWTVEFSADGDRLVSASSDGTSRIWDARPVPEKRPSAWTDVPNPWVNGGVYSPDGRSQVGLSYGRVADDDVRLISIDLVDAQTGEVKKELEVPTRKVVQPDGEEFEEPTVIIRNVRAVAFSKEGRFLAAGADHAVRVWNVESGDQVVVFQGHRRPVHTVSFSPKGDRGASIDDYGTVKIWDAKTGNEVATLNNSGLPVLSLAFNRDGTRLATAGLDSNVLVWDVASGKVIATCRGHRGTVAEVAYNPVGDKLVSAGWDHTVRVWDANTGKSVLTIGEPHSRGGTGHTDRVNGVTFSPDGALIASASDDRTVRIWETESGAERAKHVPVSDLYPSPVLSVTFRPDGKQLAAKVGEQVRVLAGEWTRAPVNDRPPDREVAPPPRAVRP
jgi:WD40 repeat protein